MNQVLLPYRTSDYFNEVDDFIFYKGSGRGFERDFFVSKTYFSNGAWYTTEGLQYKATSLRALKIKTTGIHTTHGLYANGDWKVNGVDPKHIFNHIRCNVTMRYGRALFVDLEPVYRGCVSEEGLKDFRNLIGLTDWEQHKCTTPYH